uniref:anoctamin-8-like isoform X2 n=1 Tax=Myxine glutinosa TaxID=7769 RepID=UPI00358FADBA
MPRTNGRAPRQDEDAGGADEHRSSASALPSSSFPSAHSPPCSDKDVLDRLFGRKLASSLVRTRSWMITVPTDDCDVLISLKGSTEDHVLLWLLNKLRVGVPEIIAQFRQHGGTYSYGLYLTALHHNFLAGAEAMGLQKRVRPEFGGGFRPFTLDESFIFEGDKDPQSFLSSRDRQSIIAYWLKNLRANSGDKLLDMSFQEGQPLVPELVERGVISQVFPLHEWPALEKLRYIWLRHWSWQQPLDEIYGYFGEEVALYFAWIGICTSALVYPTSFGLVVWVFGQETFGTLLLSLLSPVWCSLLAEAWCRLQAELLYSWGLPETPVEVQEEPRQEYSGKIQRDSWIWRGLDLCPQAWCFLLSLFACLACLGLALFTTLFCLMLQDYLKSLEGVPSPLMVMPDVLLALSIPVSNTASIYIAHCLTDLENHTLQSAFEKSLVFKLILFRCINSYLCLFYIAFYLGDIDKLRELLITVLLTQQLLHLTREVLIPCFHDHVLARMQIRPLSRAWSHPDSQSQSHPESQSHSHPECHLRSNPESQLPSNPESHPPTNPDSQPVSNPECQLPSYPESQSQLPSQCQSQHESVTKIAAAPANGIGPPLEKLANGCYIKEPAVTSTTHFLSSFISPGISWVAKHCSLDARDVKARASEANLAGRGSDCLEPSPGEKTWPRLLQAEVESGLSKYKGTTQGRLDMLAELGYVALFLPACPLAVLGCVPMRLASTFALSRQLCTWLQRPFARHNSNENIWQEALEVLGILVVIVNCALIGQIEQFRGLCSWLKSSDGVVKTAVVLEHILLLLRFVICKAFPKVPGWIWRDRECILRQRHKVFKDHERVAQLWYRQKEEEERRGQEQASKDSRNHTSKGSENGVASPPLQKEKGIPQATAPCPATSTIPKPPEKTKRPNSLPRVARLRQMLPLQSLPRAGSPVDCSSDERGRRETRWSSLSPAERPLHTSGGEGRLRRLLRVGTVGQAGASPTGPVSPSSLFSTLFGISRLESEAVETVCRGDTENNSQESLPKLGKTKRQKDLN